MTGTETETEKAIGICNLCLSEKVARHCTGNEKCPWLVCKLCKATSGPDGRYFTVGKR